MQISEDYVIDVVYSYTRRPTFNKSVNAFNFECPICNEGGSRNKKRRAYYLPQKENIYCHNCNWSSKPLKWILKVTGKSYEEVRNECGDFYSSANSIINPLYEQDNKVSQTLPKDSINLLDDTQVEYYRERQGIKEALHYIEKRRITTAKYRPKAIYYSLSDPIYKNTVCFPFYDLDRSISFFQVRELDETARPKYRSKLNGEKTLFNIDKIDPSFPYIFLFEGPIDSMFVKNAVSIAGTSITEFQKQQLAMYPLHKVVWCLDNIYRDDTAKSKAKTLLESGESVCIWPERFRQFKDVNELCMKYDLDEISSKFIIDNTYSSKIKAIADGIIL